MPTYEYRCPKGHTFDLFQKMSDDPVAECPECGAASDRMLSAGAGLLFKGEGFYITDYRSDSYRKAASKESGGKGPDGPKAAEKSEGKTSGSSGSEGSASAKD